jgi:hypothetical protein
MPDTWVVVTMWIRKNKDKDEMLVVITMWNRKDRDELYPALVVKALLCSSTQIYREGTLGDYSRVAFSVTPTLHTDYALSPLLKKSFKSMAPRVLLCTSVLVTCSFPGFSSVHHVLVGVWVWCRETLLTPTPLPEHCCCHYMLVTLWNSCRYLLSHLPYLFFFLNTQKIYASL